MSRPIFMVQPGARIGPFDLGITRPQAYRLLPEGAQIDEDENGLWIVPWGIGLLFDHDSRCIRIIARSGWPDHGPHVDLVCEGIPLNDHEEREGRRDLRNLAIDFDGHRWPSLGLAAHGYENGDEVYEWVVSEPTAPVLEVIGGRRIGALRLGTAFSELAARDYGDRNQRIEGDRVVYPRFGLSACFDNGHCSAIELCLPLPADLGLRVFPLRRVLSSERPELLRELIERIRPDATGKSRGLRIIKHQDMYQLQVEPSTVTAGAS